MTWPTIWWSENFLSGKKERPDVSELDRLDDTELVREFLNWVLSQGIIVDNSQNMPGMLLDSTKLAKRKELLDVMQTRRLLYIEGRNPGDVLYKSSFKVCPDIEVFVSWWGPPVDPTIEIERRKKELAQVVKRIASKEKKLSNGDFVSRAPVEIVQRERDSLAELKDRHMAFLGE